MTEVRGGSRGRDVALERIPYDPVAWEAVLRRYPDAEVFHSPAWLAFLTASQGAEPVIAGVRVGGRPAGHFVGAMVRRFGIPILGSPLPGWGTECMGFLGDVDLDRRAAADALASFAFKRLGCLHVDLADRWLPADQMTDSGYVRDSGSTFVVDLEPSEEAIFRRMNPHARQYTKRAVRRGFRAEISTDLDFADLYYERLRDVFGRQGLVPTYDVDRVRHLIRAVQPTGQLLLLRICSPDGATVATSISVGRNATATAWGAASFRRDWELHPNEPLWWEMIRYWREKGAVRLDMGGGGDYKSKYGGVRTQTARFHRSRFAALRYGRAAYSRLVDARQAAAGRWGRHAGPVSDGEERPASASRA